MPLTLRRTLEYSYDGYNQIPKADPTLVLHLNTQIPNDEKDTVWCDYSIYGNHGQIYGAKWTPEGLIFDGVDDYVSVAHSSSQVFTTFSISIWFKSNISFTSTLYKGLIRKYGISGSAFRLFTGYFGNFFETHVYTSDGDFRLDVPVSNPLVWNYLGYVYDGSSLKAYINTVLVASRSVTGTLINSTEPIIVGYSALIADSYWNGLIGEVQVYSRALSADEILALYNKTKPLYLYRRGYL
jgi:hypothetical protein